MVSQVTKQMASFGWVNPAQAEWKTLLSGKLSNKLGARLRKK